MYSTWRLGNFEPRLSQKDYNVYGWKYKINQHFASKNRTDNEKRQTMFVLLSTL